MSSPNRAYLQCLAPALSESTQVMKIRVVLLDLRFNNGTSKYARALAASEFASRANIACSNHLKKPRSVLAEKTPKKV